MRRIGERRRGVGERTVAIEDVRGEFLVSRNTSARVNSRHVPEIMPAFRRQSRDERERGVAEAEHEKARRAIAAGVDSWRRS